MNRKGFLKTLGLGALISKVFPVKGMDLYENKENELPKQPEVKLEKFIMPTGNFTITGQCFYNDPIVSLFSKATKYK